MNAAIDKVEMLSTECAAEVTREGHLEPCGKPAVAVAYDPYPFADLPPFYVVCRHHARGRHMLRLDALEALVTNSLRKLLDKDGASWRPEDGARWVDDPEALAIELRRDFR